MRVKVLRKERESLESYWETFEAEVRPDMTIASLLDYINYNDDIVDASGKPTTRISWEHSCLQGMCGACAMVINGVPALACETMVKDLKGDEITIQPLQKFPVIKDLVVDRTVIHDNLRKSDIYIGEYSPKSGISDKEHRHQYDAAKCLKCGLCLEVCPNYVNGENFFGAIYANDCYLVSARNPSRSSEIKASYKEHFGSTCSKSFSCMDVCPMNIPTLASMAKMNRR